jgi:protein SCO1
MMKQKTQGLRINWSNSNVALLLVLFLLACNSSNKSNVQESPHKEKSKLLLPVFGEPKIGANGDTLYHTVGNFSFVNQFGDTISDKTIANKMYVADFFFATCEGICPKMSDQLKRVQNKFLNDSNFLILSHTVNPSNDNVQVLNEYGGKYGAIINKWHLMTGDKKSIYDLAKTSYLVNAIEDDGSEQGFLHSETFLLVDMEKRLRGIYDGTDSIDVNRLMKDVEILKLEENNHEKR